ncbi:hypothetical protein [Saccharothrix variisporea]|uniref:Uncharacterized protein n=1 Tax=Saccharothrix variisporea TaxID=543527 RepID=A0A495X0S4_9PSEU|nr:hypothetical protein [Saccharothrix variisporea]RKT67427.1 hypothetical protein DFJ66_0602 [Saccharothrix variisporea]
MTQPDHTTVERRLRAAFTALADTVDDTEPRPNRERASTRPILAAAAGTVLIAGAVGLALTLRHPAPQPPAAEQTTTTTTATTTATTTTTRPTGPAIPYRLYTHCGIDEAKIGDTYYEALTPLHDGAHNPPPGWDNPYQDGTMTLLSDTEAVFRDDKGHEVAFKARPGATAPKQLCA